MARGRKAGPSRLDRRREAEAVEAQETEGVEVEEEEDAEEEEEAEEEAGESDEGEDEEGSKKKKKPAAKKKAAPKAKKPAAKKRVRTPKEVRQKAVWVVFDNSSKRIDTFPFSEKAQAEALLAKKIQEKEGKATFYLNLVKEPIE